MTHPATRAQRKHAAMHGTCPCDMCTAPTYTNQDKPIFFKGRYWE